MASEIQKTVKSASIAPSNTSNNAANPKATATTQKNTTTTSTAEVTKGGDVTPSELIAEQKSGDREGSSVENTPTNTVTSVTEDEDDRFPPAAASAPPPPGGGGMVGNISYYEVATGRALYDNTSANPSQDKPSPLSPPRATVPGEEGTNPTGASSNVNNPGSKNKNNNNNRNQSNNSNKGAGDNRTNVIPPPPASPLFPRYVPNPNTTTTNNNYMSASSPVVVYPSPYALATNPGEEDTTTANWMASETRSSQLNGAGAASPQLNSQGMPMMSYGAGTGISSNARSARTYSFEESMLQAGAAAGGAADATGVGARLPQELINPAYSPYGGSTTSSVAGGAGGTLFAHQWPYSGPPPDIYGNTPPSPLQPRPSSAATGQNHQFLHGGGQPPPIPHGNLPMGYPPHPGSMGMRTAASGQPPMSTVGPYGSNAHHHLQPPLPGTIAGGPPPQFVINGAGGFPTSSPGPPIQTTTSNKGPDGANLFIFHIPNHFTNLDMYQLFEPYGNLLSVRIMVERDTGRSRGFGFVSYDSPESAALAIKALNGFAIGNKRLKVQHKQIRPRDMNDRDQQQQQQMNGYGQTVGGGYAPQQQYPNFPPGTGWYNNNGTIDPSNGQNNKVQVQNDEHTELTSSATSTTAEVEQSLSMGNNNNSNDPTSMSPLANLGSLHTALPDVNNNNNPSGTTAEAATTTTNPETPNTSSTTPTPPMKAEA